MALPDSGFTGPPPIEVGNPPDIPPQPAGREWTPFGFDVPRNSYGGGGFERVFAAPAAPALPFMRAPASSASVVATASFVHCGTPSRRSAYAIPGRSRSAANSLG